MSHEQIMERRVRKKKGIKEEGGEQRVGRAGGEAGWGRGRG